MNKFKNTCLGLMAAAAFFTAVPACEAASIDVPENVFQWVQSTARQNYYFNKEQMCYAVNPNGEIDIGTLIVPTLRTFDDVQKQDVIDKRRWKMLSVKGYDDLVGWTGLVDFMENVDAETEVSLHAKVYLYGGEETVTATPEEVTYLMMRMERDENFLAGHCDNIEAVDFSFLRPPEEYCGMKL